MKNSKAPRRLGSNSLTKESAKKAENSVVIQPANPKEQICDICAQNVPGSERSKIFALGKCDHHVCYVCSARLRVICDQFECPICRKKLEDVVFSSSRNQPYRKYNLQDCLYDEKYKIYFETKAIKEAFDKLLKYECLECLKAKSITCPAKTTNDKPLRDEQLRSSPSNETPQPNKDNKQSKNNRRDVSNQTGDSDRDTSSPRRHLDGAKPARGESSADPLDDETQGLLKSSDLRSCVFKDVFGLRTHLDIVHKLKLCDLCLTHNKLFPFEFSYYDFMALRKHMRDGEPNTSHRGHPSCPLCKNVFFNKDELIQHMSREHYHCHLCGRHDSNMLIYFSDYDDLRLHFKGKHYLCERGNCRYEQFTSAFDNKIDYQLHVVQVHGNPTTNLSRGEARQQRTITLDPAPHRAREMSPDRLMRQNRQPNSAVVSTGPMATANSLRQPRPESLQAEIIQQRLPSRAEFPALGQYPTSDPSRPMSASVPASYVNSYPSLAQTNPGPTASSSTTSQRAIAGPSTMRDSFLRSAGGGIRQPEYFGAVDFPPLPEQPKGKKAKKKTVTSRANGRSDNSVMSLDQLISSSLIISSETARAGGAGGSKRNGSKSGALKSQKSTKQRPLKIQLS